MANETGRLERGPLPLNLHRLNEMLPKKAENIESDGSFYAGTLEREWLYRKLCELGFFTRLTRDLVEEKRRLFQAREGSFSFTQVFQECMVEEKMYVASLSRALLLAERGILSIEELKEFEEVLRSGDDGAAFLEAKQKQVEDSLKEAFPPFSSFASSELERFLPLHAAFQTLIERGLASEEDEERYFCGRSGITVMPNGDRIVVPSLRDWTRWDSMLASLNTIRRALALGVVSQQQSDSLVKSNLA